MAVNRAPIDLFASLREVGTTRVGASKWGIEIKVGGLTFNADEKAIAAEYAAAITETIRENMSSGKAPDGTPLPGVSSATAERRGYRLQQAARGGALPSKYQGATPEGREKIRRARKSWNLRFRATRLGKFEPKPSAAFGLESGMLARSAFAAWSPPDKAFNVYFADSRAVLRGHGKTAVERVFERVKPWSARGMSQPRIQEAGKRAFQSLFMHRGGEAIAGLLDLADKVLTTVEQVDDAVKD